MHLLLKWWFCTSRFGLLLSFNCQKVLLTRRVAYCWTCAVNLTYDQCWLTLGSPGTFSMLACKETGQVHSVPSFQFKISSFNQVGEASWQRIYVSCAAWNWQATWKGTWPAIGGGGGVPRVLVQSLDSCLQTKSTSLYGGTLAVHPLHIHLSSYLTLISKNDIFLWGSEAGLGQVPQWVQLAKWASAIWIHSLIQWTQCGLSKGENSTALSDKQLYESLESGADLDCDGAIFANSLHGIRDDVTNGFVTIGRDCSHLKQHNIHCAYHVKAEWCTSIICCCGNSAMQIGNWPVLSPQE